MSGITKFFSDLFGSIGASLNNQAQQATDTATQAFYVIAGELAIIIVLLIGIFVSNARRG